MTDGYTVLSIFDGMSCGRVALDELNIPVKQYYASEIDPYAITVATNNYMDTIQLGDVTKVDGHLLPKIDLLIGGSPCQGFSFAGKQLNFEDPRSKLFFEFVRLLKECKPKFFFLENVRMKKEYQDVISSYLGVDPVALNSNLISAQNRYRLYWTNIPGYVEPKDEEVYLPGILETKIKNLKICKVNNTPSRDKMWYGGKCKNITNELKSSCLTTKMDRWNNAGLIEFEDYCRFLTPTEAERLQTLPDGYTTGVSYTERYRMLGNGWTVAAVKEFFKHLPPVEDLDLY